MHSRPALLIDSPHNAKGTLTPACKMETLMVRSLNTRLLMQFTQKKADGEIRWAILSVVTLLRRHSKTHKQLAKAMAAGKTVTECLAIIESNFAKENAQQPQIA